MRITLHIEPFTVTIIVKKRGNRHSANDSFARRRNYRAANAAGASRTIRSAPAVQ